MAKTASYSMDSELGCGFMGGILQLRKNYFPRKPSLPSLPTSSNNIAKVHSSKTSTDDSKKARAHNSSRRIRSGTRETDLQDSNLAKPPTKTGQKPMNHPKNQQGRSPSDAARSSTSSNGSNQTKEPTRVSVDLTKAMITPRDQSNENKALVRATSSNVMLLGQLGNLRQLGTGHLLASNSPNATIKTVDYLSRNLQDHRHIYGKVGGHGMMGNIVRQSSDLRQIRSLGLTNKLDPEAVKSMGNEAYKRGSYEEALALYDRAIALDSSKATYRSNRSAALIGLGRLVDAVAECKEAIRIEPSYQRAHHRLATLYLRLGKAEKALYHYNLLGSNVDSKDIAKSQSLHKHLSMCNEARKFKEWSTLLKESHYAISAGTDSAPLVYAMQVEALMKLQRHQEAYAIFRKRPSFGIDSCTKLFGLVGCAYMLMVDSQVYLTAGRFDDALGAAQHAARLDPSNEEVIMVGKRARAVSSARMSGNLLFKAAKFAEACALYSEGLEHDQYNSVLLCNRAACRAKLGQYEKAVEDCTAALAVQPCYSKARLRRADCNAKMERWEASIQDYEMLKRESPGDEEVGRALFETQVQLRKQRGEDTKDMKFGSNLVLITSNERFRHFVTSPGMSVVLFCNKTKQKQVLQPMQQVCKRFPSVNFLKVEVEDHPYLAKSEGVRSIPAFKIYKNGSQVKEIPGSNRDLLESSVRVYST